MKKKIAIWLFKLARRLYPISVTVFEQKEILEPKVCAKAYRIDKNYIRHYKRDHHVKSMREALRERKLSHRQRKMYSILSNPRS